MAALERRGLWISASAALAFAVVGIAWGIAASSQIILFDGFYALIGLALSWMGLRAGRLIEAGPTAAHPFGRETLGPLVVGIQGTVLLGSLGYAGLEAIQTLLSGGGSTSDAIALGYAAVNLIGSIVVFTVLRRMGERSELVVAEAVQWRASAVLGVVMFIGFGGAVLLTLTGVERAAAYVDPVLMLIAVVLLAPTPLRMIRATVRELLEAAPGPDIALPVESAVEAIRAKYQLPEPTVRLGKLGRKLYVELDFFVGDTGWTVADVDRIRRDLAGHLHDPNRVLWLNVELHADPNWDA